MGISLKDVLHFERNITPTIVKFFYWIVGAAIILGAAIGSLVAITEAFSYYGGGVGNAIAGVLIALIGGAVGLVLWRMFCEGVLLLFTMGENLRKLRKHADRAIGAVASDDDERPRPSPAAASSPSVAAAAAEPPAPTPKPSPTL